VPDWLSYFIPKLPDPPEARLSLDFLSHLTDLMLRFDLSGIMRQVSSKKGSLMGKRGAIDLLTDPPLSSINP